MKTPDFFLGNSGPRVATSYLAKDFTHHTSTLIIAFNANMRSMYITSPSLSTNVIGKNGHVGLLKDVGEFSIVAFEIYDKVLLLSFV